MKARIEKRTGPRGVAYRIRVELPVDPITGERRRASKTVETRREAERVLAEWVTEINRGTAVEPSTVTVGELLHRWLESVSAHRVRGTTLDGYRATIDHYLIPHLGHNQAQKLSPAAAPEFYAERRNAGAGARSVRLCHLRLSQTLAHAVRRGLLPRNVCNLVDPPSVKHKPGKTWTRDEARRFMAASEADGLHPLWLVAVSTGLRRGELLGLRWQDLDLDARSLRVMRSVVMRRGAPVIQEPKSVASRRMVKLHPETVVALRSHRARQAERRLHLGPI